MHTNITGVAMSKMQVKILKGTYRGKEVTGTFPLVAPFKNGARGGFITVRAEITRDLFQTVSPRITCEVGDFVLINEEGTELTEYHEAGINSVTGGITVETNYEQAFIASETEDEAIERIRHSFSMLDKITDSVARGIIRGVVVTGPPGCGKSHGVEKELIKANLFRTLRGDDPKYEFITGGTSAIGLYQKLYNNREKGRVLCLDDSDSTLFDEECLSLLKGALNSGDRRRICWNKESRVLLSEDIPNAFDFHGGIIFLTNIDFTNVRQGRIAEHLKAIMDRCHYMDLEIGSVRDRILRIKQVVADGMLKEFDFENGEENMIIDWVVDNIEYLREISLRIVIKVAQFVASDINTWKEFAESTVLKKEARFKRLLRAKQLQSVQATEQVAEQA